MTAFIDSLTRKELLGVIMAWLAANWTVILGLLVFMFKQKVAAAALEKNTQEAIQKGLDTFEKAQEIIMAENTKAIEAKFDELLDKTCNKFGTDKEQAEKEYQEAKKLADSMPTIDLDNIKVEG